MNYSDQFTPVDPDFYDLIQQAIETQKSGKIFFFDPSDQVEDHSGHALYIQKSKEGEFLKLETDYAVRLDKIITLYGRPGPAYDAYDRFANACLTCEDLDQF